MLRTLRGQYKKFLCSMTRTISAGCLPLISGILISGISALGQAEEPASGKLVARVQTADGKASYACYLPKAYRTEKNWPALVAFSPDGQGSRLAGHFRAAAEQAGWIVLASNDSRNGPFRGEEIEALWKDAQTRFSIDTSRLYVAGFSGGARVATWFGGEKKAIGHVAIGGLHFPGDRNTPPEQRAPLPPMAYALVCGHTDFNQQELADAAKGLRAAHRPVKLLTFPGGHTMPPPRVTAAAVSWLDGLDKPQSAAPP